MSQEVIVIGADENADCKDKGTSIKGEHSSQEDLNDPALKKLKRIVPNSSSNDSEAVPVKSQKSQNEECGDPCMKHKEPAKKNDSSTPDHRKVESDSSPAKKADTSSETSKKPDSIFGSAFSGPTFMGLGDPKSNINVFHKEEPKVNSNINFDTLLKVKIEDTSSQDGSVEGSEDASEAKNEKDSSILNEKNRKANEDDIHSRSCAKLYMWDRETSTWNCRGPITAEICTNEKEKKSWIAIRARGSERIVQNTSIFPEMKHTIVMKSNVTFIGTDERGSLSKFFMKFQNELAAKKFIEDIDHILS